MKRFATFSFIAVLAITAIMVMMPQHVGAQGAGLVSSIVNRMERNRRDLRSLRAGVVMQKYNAQIGDEDNYFGEMIYLPGAGRNVSVRVDWQKPQHETLAVADGKYTLFRPRLKMAYQGSANSNRNKVSSVLGFGLNVTRQQLASKFQALEYLGEGVLYADVYVTHLRLVPKGNESYKYAEIWVDRSGMPVQTRVVERNDDSTTVRLTNVQRNAQVSPDEFRLQLGSEIKIIRS